MHISPYDIVVTQFSSGLSNLKGVLEKARSFADVKKIEFPVLLQTRLVPDQFALGRQIQIVSDTAKACAATLTGQSAPAMEDNEVTFEEFIGRIDKTIAFLSSLNVEQFDGFEKRRHTSARRPGLHLEGTTYLLQHAIPNFYFHLTTAYSILRANGVEIGKRDYLGAPLWKAD